MVALHSILMILGCLRRLQVVLGLDIVKLLLFLVHVHTLEGLVGLVVEYDEVAVAHIEAGQMVACIFGIENVFVDNERSAACLRRIATVNVQMQL